MVPHTHPYLGSCKLDLLRYLLQLPFVGMVIWNHAYCCNTFTLSCFRTFIVMYIFLDYYEILFLLLAEV